MGQLHMNGVYGRFRESREQTQHSGTGILGRRFSAWPTTAASSGEEGCSAPKSRRRGWPASARGL